MGQLSLRTTAFYVQDVPATLDFYDRAFGMRMRYLHPSWGYAELETGDTLLSFVSEEFLRAADLLGGVPVVCARRGEPLGAQIALVSRDLDGDWRRAVEAGATILKAPEPKPWARSWAISSTSMA
jgi:lactoylglutathione lyase